MELNIWIIILFVAIAVLYLATFALLFYNLIFYVIKQQRYKAKSKLLSIFYLNAFFMLCFQVAQFCNQLFNESNFRATVTLLSAAGMMMLNTGILMMLMMVEIKSIFRSATFKELSERKITNIMLAGIVYGILVDLPIEISWFFNNFTQGSNDLSFVIIYNVVMFSLTFIFLTIVSLRLILELNKHETHSGAFRKEKQNLITMLVTFDITFLLWVCYYAFLLPEVLKAKSQQGNHFN